MSGEFVLDASALLSILLEESGGDRVREILDRSRMHAVNVAEVIGRLVRRGVPVPEAIEWVAEFHFDVDEKVTGEQAGMVGALMGTRRDLGLSFGDWVCLTTAARAGAVAVTADQQWKALDGEVFWGMKFRVELIR